MKTLHLSPARLAGRTKQPDKDSFPLIQSSLKIIISSLRGMQSNRKKSAAAKEKKNGQEELPREILNYLQFICLSTWTRGKDSFILLMNYANYSVCLALSCPQRESGGMRICLLNFIFCLSKEQLFIWLNELHTNLCSSFRDWVNKFVQNVEKGSEGAARK